MFVPSVQRNFLDPSCLTIQPFASASPVARKRTLICGIILSDANRDLLSARGTVFYLDTPIDIQLERTSKDKDRPLLKDGDPRKILTDLHEKRESLYQSVADYVVETSDKSSQEVANEIIKLVKNYG